MLEIYDESLRIDRYCVVVSRYYVIICMYVCMYVKGRNTVFATIIRLEFY